MSDDLAARILAGVPLNGPAPVGSGDGADDLLRRWTLPELLAEPDEFAWLAKGLLVDPTYGQIGGELKTLKSVVATFVAVAVAAGRPIFDHFDVGAARPVVAYVGEGGRRPYVRRLRRIAGALGVKTEDLPLYPVFDVAPLASPIFRESLARDLRDIEPGLVVLDPLYMYHGTTTRAADLHAEGALLGGLSRPCVDAGVSLLVVNHFNQTGTGMSLKRITMAGSGEWADSWILLAHRVDPDLEAGLYRLTLAVGSRQWGGTEWELDVSLGRFDAEKGDHEGDIAWDLRRASTARRAEQSADKILELVAHRPYQLTREEIVTGVGGNKERMRVLVDKLHADGRLALLHGIRQTLNGRTRKTWLYGPKSDDVPAPKGRASSLPAPPEMA